MLEVVAVGIADFIVQTVGVQFGSAKSHTFW